MAKRIRLKFLFGFILAHLFIFTIKTLPASAAITCNNYTSITGGSIDAINEVCGWCSSKAKSGLLGTMWLSPDPNLSSSSNLMSTYQPGDITTDSYLHGGLYKCGGDATDSNATHIFFSANEISGATPAKVLNIYKTDETAKAYCAKATSTYPGYKDICDQTFITSVASRTLKRGSVSSGKTWSLSTSNIKVTLNISKFQNGTSGVQSGASDCTPGKIGKKYCAEQATYIYRCPPENKVHDGVYKDKNCFTQTSKIRIGAEAIFVSKSKVSVNEGSNPFKETAYDSNDTLTYEVPASQSSVNVTFSHTIARTDNWMQNNWNFPAATNWKTDNTATNKSGTTPNLDMNLKSYIVGGETLNISLTPGETKNVCRTISYSPKYYRGDGSSSGNGSSKICIKIVVQKAPSITEHSTVQIAGKSNDNNNDTRVGKAEIQRENRGNTTYNATFSHKLTLEKTMDNSDVDYIIYRVDNGDTSHPTAIASGTVNFNSSNPQFLLLPSSAPNVQTVTSTGTNIGSVCEYVVYTPRGLSLGSVGTPVTTHMVCAQVNPPDPDPGLITATTQTSTPSSFQIPLSRDSAPFHFSHHFFNENPANISLSTTYKVHIKINLQLDDEDGEAEEETTTASYFRAIQSSGAAYRESSAISGTTRNISPNLSSDPTPIIDHFTYNIPQGSTVKICEYVEFSFNNFSIIDYTATGSGTGKSEEKCIEVSRPKITWYQDDDFELTASTEHTFGGDTSKLYPSAGLDRLVGSTSNISMNFSHILYFPYKDHRATINDINYNYGNETNSLTNINFPVSVKTSIAPGDNLTLTSSPDPSMLSNRLTISSLAVGETKRNCRNLYFKNSKFLVSHAYITLHGTKLSDEPIGDPIQEPVEGSVGNSDLVCASVTRPYNFHINENSLSTTAPDKTYVGDKLSSTYSFSISKSHDDSQDWRNFYATGIPNAEIRLYSIIFNSEEGRELPELTISDTVSDPVSFYESSLRSAGFSSYEISELETEIYNIIKNESGIDKPISPILDSDLVDGSYSSIFHSKEYYVPRLEPGQKFCTALAISPSDSGRGLNESDFIRDWNVSGITCSNIAKKPTIQIYGGSVFAPSGIDTSKTSLLDEADESRTYFGSWSDFSLISNQSIKMMGSGASLAKGNSEADKLCSYSPLTIANISCKSETPIELGYSNISRAMSPENLYSTLVSKLVDESSLESASGLPLRIEDGGVIKTSNSLIIYSKNEKNIEIASDLLYSEIGDDEGISERKDIPQILILSGGNLKIDESVKEIDAWIITKGDITTCDGFYPNTDELTVEKCNSKLLINGPVVSKNLILPRTYGADPSVAVDSEGDPGEGNAGLNLPAELINFTPSTILWSYDKSTSDGRPNTTYLKELAPRY